MYHPTSRVLTVLELLQSHPSITGPALAARLEMDVRTVRRYITHLQDVGIPIESNIGRYGGYRLRPGFKLPPLIFSEEEALAIMLGLLTSPWLEFEQSSVAIEGALAKLSRVLPAKARKRLEALSTHMILYPEYQQNRPNASLLLDLTNAIQASQCISIKYHSYQQKNTERKVEPYGIAGWQGHWYLVGYCCLRQDYRVFRLDRIQGMQLLEETFKKAGDFDYQTFLADNIRTTYTTQIEVEFLAEMSVVQQKIPSLYGQLSPTAKGVILRELYDDLESMARYLITINIPFIIHNPPELRETLRRLGEQMIQMANTLPTAQEPSNYSVDDL